MIENQRVRVTTPQCWCKNEMKRPFFSYRGKVWIAITIGAVMFWIVAAQVIAELTYQLH